MNIYKQIFQLHADLLKALSHPKRLEVVHLLRDKQMCVGEIQEMLGLSQANLSQHLQVLRDAEVLQTQRDGQKVFYKLSDKNIVEASDLLREVLIDRYHDTQLGKQLASQIKDMVPLVRDPICGMRLSPKTAAYAHKSNSKTHYFCAEGCLKKYKSKESN